MLGAVTAAPHFCYVRVAVTAAAVIVVCKIGLTLVVWVQ